LPVNIQNNLSFAGGSYGVVMVDFGNGRLIPIFVLIKAGDAVDCAKPKPTGPSANQ
jgi:hypothetical protein